MEVEAGSLHSTSALVGAMIGGGASFAAAIYTQWHQDRLKRIDREAIKREAIYGDFIMSASKVLVNAYISENLSWTGDEQHLIGLVNRMRLFAPPHVIGEAETVIRSLVQIAQQPKVTLEELAETTRINNSFAPDLLYNFSVATQADLRNVHRSADSKTIARALRRVIIAFSRRQRHCMSSIRRWVRFMNNKPVFRNGSGGRTHPTNKKPQSQPELWSKTRKNEPLSC